MTPPIVVNPMLPLWLLVPAAVAVIGFAVWRVVRARGSRLAGDWIARLVLVLILFVIAFRPTVPAGDPGPAAAGALEVYFVVDTTSSMAAEDFGDPAGPRLDGVRADIGEIARSLQGAEFALVTFDSSALQRVPLTSDLSALRSSVSALSQEVTNYSAGSSIDGALDLMSRLLAEAAEQNPERPRVAFYFGDGEQTAENEPRSFTPLAGRLDGGAVLGYGTAEGGRMRTNAGYPDNGAERAYIRDYSVEPVTDAVSRIDEQRLGTIAADLGVGYSHRSQGDPVDALVAGIDTGAPSESAAPPAAAVELYWWFAIPLGLLLLREAIVVALAIRELRTPRREVR